MITASHPTIFEPVAKMPPFKVIRVKRSSSELNEPPKVIVLQDKGGPEVFELASADDVVIPPVKRHCQLLPENQVDGIQAELLIPEETARCDHAAIYMESEDFLYYKSSITYFYEDPDAPVFSIGPEVTFLSDSDYEDSLGFGSNDSDSNAEDYYRNDYPENDCWDED